MDGGRSIPLGPALRVAGGVLVLASLALPRVSHSADVTLTGGSNTSLVMAAAFMLAGGIAAVVAPGSRVARYGLISSAIAVYLVFRAYGNADTLVSEIQASGSTASIGAQIWVAGAGIVLTLAGFAIGARSPAT
jgi:hypothetical protein